MRFPIVAVVSLLVVSPVLAQHLTPQPNYGESTGTFPTWEERAVAELTNRARVDPAADLAACPNGQCAEAGCYAATAPVMWNYDLNQSSRFESASMARFPFFAHDTPCQLFSDIDSRFPGSSDGSFASSCSASGTTTSGTRVSLFGARFTGENIAAGFYTPHDVFYAWLYETAGATTCGFTLNNGHRYNILTNIGPALGVGYAAVDGSPYFAYWTQDFGGAGTIPKIPSGSHWTSVNHGRDASVSDSSVEFWANWYDASAPTSATVVLDNVPRTMTRSRGTAANGAYTATVAGVSAACHTYYFSFVDSSLATVRYPTNGNLGFGAGCPDFQDGGTAPAAPTGVSAMAMSSTQVQVSWSPVVGATSYEVYRRDPGSTTFLLRGTSLTTSYMDTASSGQAYLYRARAMNATGASGDSAVDLATTVMFTDDALAAGVTVKAAHLAELRTAVSAVRAQARISAATYTDAASAGVLIKAVHITELRTYLNEALTALGFSTSGWTDATLTGMPIKAVHFQEIRNRVK